MAKKKTFKPDYEVCGQLLANEIYNIDGIKFNIKKTAEEADIADIYLISENQQIPVQITFAGREYAANMGKSSSYAVWKNDEQRLWKEIIYAISDKSKKYGPKEKAKTILLLIGSLFFDNKEWIGNIKSSLTEGQLCADAGFREIWFIAYHNSWYCERLSKK